MAQRPRFPAADPPYISDRDITAHNAARGRMGQVQSVHGYAGYEDDLDPRIPRHKYFNHRQDLKRAAHGLANMGGVWCPPSKNQYDGIDPLEFRHSGLPYHGPPPYDATDGEPGYGLRGHRSNHSPPAYDVTAEELDSSRRARRPYRSPSRYNAADAAGTELKSSWRKRRLSLSPPPYDAAHDDLAFDDERRSGRHRHALGRTRLRSHSHETDLGCLDKGFYNDIHREPQYPPRHSLHRTHEIGLNSLSGLGPQMRRGPDAHLNEYDGDCDMTLRRHRREFESLEDDSESDDTDSSFSEASEHQLDSQSSTDDIKAKFLASRQRVTAAKEKYLRSLIQLQEKLDVIDRQRAQVNERHSQEDVTVETTGFGKRDNCADMPRSTESHGVDERFNGVFKTSPLNRRTIPSRPKHARGRRVSRDNQRADSDFTKLSGRNAQQYPTYDFKIPTSYARTVIQEAIDVASRPFANPFATIDANKRKTPIKEYPRHQNNRLDTPIDQLNNGKAAHKGTEEIHSSNNNRFHAGTQEVRANGTHSTSRAEWGWGSDTSDGGCDTPDGNESENSGVLVN